jgi:SNF2 family DNA or RNA helicase
MTEFQLFPYQVEGAKWLAGRKCALLADEMGLGKSAQAITAADLIKALRILVICPAIARVNWQREFERFSKIPREFTIINKRLKKWPLTSVICSYDLASSVEDSKEFDLMILDEAHYLKNKDAKRTKAILGKTGLVRKARATWALTGTPAPNHPGELWPLLFTFGAIKSPYFNFVEEFCDVFESNYGLQIVGAKRSSINKLKSILAPHLLRRRKEEVMKELPPIHFQDLVVEPGVVDIDVESSFVKYAMSADTRIELQRILASEQSLLRDIATKASVDTAVGFNTFQAIAPSVSTLRRYTGVQKVQPVADLVAEELSSNAYDKIVIFAIHRDVIEGLRVRLAKFGAVTLYGGTSPETKQRNLDKFQKQKGTRVFIANIQSAGTAVTLTASNQVLFAEQDWVPGNNAQAVMRCHRIGQTRPVFARFCAIAGTIDERIAAALKRKTKELTMIFDDEPIDLPDSDSIIQTHD